MRNIKLIQPPGIVEVAGKVIFLAGPIQGAPDWQIEAARIIHELDPKVTIASPRRDYEPGTFVYEAQVDWETHFLRRADVILFWLAAQTVPTPGRAYAQTTRFELAEWKMHHEHDGSKITLGIEDGFGNARYIRRRFSLDCPDVLIADTLKETCLNAVQLLKGADQNE